jgi:hypothetical protein
MEAARKNLHLAMRRWPREADGTGSPGNLRLEYGGLACAVDFFWWRFRLVTREETIQALRSWSELLLRVDGEGERGTHYTDSFD